MDKQNFEFVNFPFSYSARPRDEKSIENIRYADRNAYLLLSKIALKLLPNDETYLRNYVKKVVQNISNSEDVAKLLPPLGVDAVQEFSARLDSVLSQSPNIYAHIGFALVSAFLVETAYAAGSSPDLAQSNFGSAISIEISSYLSWKSLQEVEISTQGWISEAIQNFELSGQNAIAHASKQLETMNQRILDLQENEMAIRKKTEGQEIAWDRRLGAISKQTSGLESTLKSLQAQAFESAKKIDLTDKNIAAFKEALIEDVRGTETRKLWTDRGNDSWVAFLISAGVLAVFLLVVPIAGFWNLDQLLGVLKHIGDAATEGIPLNATNTQLTVATLSRLVVITFPLVLYLWVIRLVVRFNTRSLVLHDDARQRQTMMDTYFLLIAQQAASKEERGLILNALFRPSPGHGSDNIEPPSFSELVGRGGSNQ
ncbi:hypothetical protein [Hoeflea alexandrii]|uniref:MotA/TolQ/ExbB proton channel domain-containing protein n=1 Tax=Hoeflea alexandrii TaxID=288436 RepID=A0ABT1CLP7_9HYPH|nr:hypothetical protein [Hoeflea alexandrii]MCO6407038.1 hypothetical protein [Hoeflea alexandrii]MCY0154521.1 hypothetical protein [Hoeflea alexandrii]